MKLNESHVVFDLVGHTYTLFGMPLSGITAVIKERTNPNKYSDVPEVILRRAAEAGTKMHNEVENYENFGLIADSPELRGYIAEKESSEYLKSFAQSEYIVTDGHTYASGIDLVFEDTNEDNSAILVDLKHTYTLDRDYVSWQLSVYAHLFEEQNQHIRVSHIFALHLRDDKHELVEVPRHSAEEVKSLLYTTEDLPTDTADTKQYPQIASTEMAIVSLKRQADEAKAKYERLANGLKNIMQQEGIKKFDGNLITVTQTPKSTRVSIDTKRLKEEMPDVYEQFSKITRVDAGIRITIKQDM